MNGSELINNYLQYLSIFHLLFKLITVNYVNNNYLHEKKQPCRLHSGYRVNITLHKPQKQIK